MTDAENQTDPSTGTAVQEEEIILLEPGKEKAQNIVKATKT